jgi:hypothetical protein
VVDHNLADFHPQVLFLAGEAFFVPDYGQTSSKKQ